MQVKWKCGSASHALQTVRNGDGITIIKEALGGLEISQSSALPQDSHRWWDSVILIDIVTQAGRLITSGRGGGGEEAETSPQGRTWHVYIKLHPQRFSPRIQQRCPHGLDLEYNWFPLGKDQEGHGIFIVECRTLIVECRIWRSPMI